MVKETVASQMWEGLMMRGVISIIFGFVAIFWPGLTLITLIYLFSAFILVSGLISLGTGLVDLFRRGGNSLLMNLLLLVIAVIETGVGIYLLRHIHVGFATFILLIGLTLIARGVVEFVTAIFSSGINLATHRWVMILSGTISVIAGVIILFQPVAGGVAFVWVLGLYALITGPLLLALAHDIKGATEVA
ncbi:MAG TPA: DUF308 domain-containing protein [Candidatus Saccharimonadales bacterium]|nr:DUF308 domain-containing protein [Candidatus Saccharimonadales bacterium]